MEPPPMSVDPPEHEHWIAPPPPVPIPPPQLSVIPSMPNEAPQPKPPPPRPTPVAIPPHPEHATDPGRGPITWPQLRQIGGPVEIGPPQRKHPGPINKPPPQAEPLQKCGSFKPPRVPPVLILQ
jgi:protein TonB